jgi:hypothetical protein
MKRAGFSVLSGAVVVAGLLAASHADAQVRPRFSGMDQNRDGAISRAEWRGNANAFRRHDWNSDGVLSGEEVRVDANQAAHNFRLVDLDNNGHVTMQEWRRAFGELDNNRDGSLTQDELWGVVDAQDNRAFTAGRERGLVDGREAGRQDGRRRVWDLDGQRELVAADAGYRAELGAREHYQNGYRDGFRQGYGEGYGPRR